MTAFIGQPVGRVDGRQKVTGAATYAAFHRVPERWEFFDEPPLSGAAPNPLLVYGPQSRRSNLAESLRFHEYQQGAA